MHSMNAQSSGPFAELLDGAFEHSSALKYGRQRLFPIDARWMIASDYCIRDPNKPNSVITYAIFPELDDFRHLGLIVSELSPHDYKNTRRISSELIEFLTISPIVFISIIHKMNDDTVPIPKHKEDVRKVVRKLEATYSSDSEMLPRIRKLLRYTQKSNFNSRLVADSMIVSYMAAFIATHIAQSPNVHQISWISDRDALIELADNFAMVFADRSFLNLSHIRNISTREVDFFLSDPNEYGGWSEFEGVLRIADYLCGIISSMDPATGLPSQGKALEGMREWIADNEKISIFEVTQRDSSVDIQMWKHRQR